MEINSDKTDPHYEVGQRNLAVMKGQKDARGRTLEIEIIEEGHYHPGIWNGGCSSYINSYLANGAVIVPGYGYDRDPLAIETYQRLYPDREVVQVQIGHIAQGGGGVHCITQQQPAPVK
jgi:agmatine deiminase